MGLRGGAYDAAAAAAARLASLAAFLRARRSFSARMRRLRSRFASLARRRASASASACEGAACAAAAATRRRKSASAAPAAGAGAGSPGRSRFIYAAALYEDPAATLDDLREAVTTLEDVERTTRRVLGGAHPTTMNIERSLRDARAALRARETPSAS